MIKLFMCFMGPFALFTISPMYFNIKHFFNYLKLLDTRTSRVVSRQAWQNRLQLEWYKGMCYFIL